jgi:NADP-dependent 3-hydroxy acid dehydrogenase YdfG
MTSSPKHCLVTGASSGIGYGIAEYLLSERHTVTVTARREDRLRQLTGTRVVSGDLTVPRFQEELFNVMFSEDTPCDYLFNCAGCIEAGTIEEIDIDRMAAMLRLNIEATFRLTYLFLKQFRKQEFGHIVNISSILGTKVRPTAGAYAASKFAMEALSEALRMELAGTPVQISCIEPGLVMTELHKHWKVHPSKSMHISEPLQVGNIIETVKFIMTQPPHVRIPRLMILPEDHII